MNVSSMSYFEIMKLCADPKTNPFILFSLLLSLYILLNLNLGQVDFVISFLNQKAKYFICKWESKMAQFSDVFLKLFAKFCMNSSIVLLDQKLIFFSEYISLPFFVCPAILRSTFTITNWYVCIAWH